MKKLLLLLSLLCLTNCVTLQQLNSNMRDANVIMSENIETMQISKASIEENTRQVKRSTETMERFELLFPIFFFLAFLAVIYVSLKLFRKFFRKKS